MIYCTYPNEKAADDASLALVSKKLAACVQRFGPIKSTYVWEGAVNSGQEWLLLIKTKLSVYDEVASLIQTIHPYQIPEIVAVPVVKGLQPYLNWMDQAISS